MKSLTILIPVLALAACSSNPPRREQASAEPAATSNAQTTQQKVNSAVVAPLSDLNLLKIDIPDVLKDATAAPYAPPSDQSCPKLAEHIALLDDALGADLDAPKADVGGAGKIERGIEGGAVSAIRDTTEGILPFRGWLRKLTGAERQSRKVSAAIAAGTVRRAYLKGIGAARGCEPSAAQDKTQQAQS